MTIVTWRQRENDHGETKNVATRKHREIEWSQMKNNNHENETSWHQNRAKVKPSWNQTNATKNTSLWKNIAKRNHRAITHATNEPSYLQKRAHCAKQNTHQMYRAPKKTWWTDGVANVPSKDMNRHNAKNNIVALKNDQHEVTTWKHTPSYTRK